MTQSNWVNRDDDMKFAEETISKHIELNEGEPIGIFEVVVNDDDAVDICVADWVIEISEHFDQKYGHEQGTQVTNMIVGRCLTRGETLH